MVHSSFLGGDSWFNADVHGDAVHRVPRVYVERLLRAPARLVSLGPTRMVSAELYVWDVARLLGPVEEGGNDGTSSSSVVGHELAARSRRTTHRRAHRR
jgi:hypothetical protein